MNEQNRYYAFISYNSADEKWAKWLQHNLEYYHIPSALCKEYPELPKKIRPIFWYKQDLSGTKLKKALNNELSSSKYLIVICSPDSAKADWVNDEVVAFIEQGKGDRIIPFIVAGTPHAKNSDEECFPPALRNLTRDEEIRGIDVRRKEGKYHALVDVIATMFGVRFDVLWQRHERRRKRIRNVWIAIVSVFLLCALGIYDYNRTKVEYYADFVDRWGVAEGIVPLDDDQVSHRHHSYKFEYARIPFGEQDSYSWRLKRVSLVNSKGVISDYVPGHHVFFYPIQEFEYTDGYVTDIINRDTYKRVVMRYSLKDDYEHNTACLIDMEGKEKRQGSAYLEASTTSMMNDVNSNSTKSKIKRFHYTRNEDGYITKITYHANDGDDLAETAIGDNNNIYGKLFELDSLGRIVTLTYINNEGTIVTDKFGVSSIKYTYDSLGETASTKYYDINEQLTNNEQKFAIIYAKFDMYGNIIELWYEDSDGKPCYDNKNRYRCVLTYDKNGCQTEIMNYGLDGNLSYCLDNYAIQRGKYDTKGRCIEVSYYDVNDKPCYINGNFSIARSKYNSNDCVVEVSFFDDNDKPCIETNFGVHKHCYKYNEYNYLTEVCLFDEKGELTTSQIYHFAKQELMYDNYHQLISARNYDNNNNPCLDRYYTHEIHYTYDKGNIIRIDYFDIEGNLCICKEGYATIIYKFDSFGNITEEKYLGKDNKPIYINMCSSIQYKYTKNGLLSEERFYDSDDSLCLNADWWAIAKYEYDKNGNCTKISYFDSDSIPCYTRNNIFSVVERIYDNGNIIEERFFDNDGTLFMNAENYAIGRYIYNDKRQVISQKYFDNNDKPSTTTNLIHSVDLIYDNRGQLLSQEFFDKYGKRCNNKNGYSKETKVYDEYGMISEVSYLDALDKPVESNLLAFKTVYVYDYYGRIVCEQHLNANGILIWQQSPNNTTGIKECWIEYEYDKFGNVTKTTYKDPMGKPTDIAGWATCLKQYDELSREIEVRYYNSLNQPIGGKFSYPIEKYAYDDNYERLSLFYDDSSLVANVHAYIEKGHMTKLSFTDKDGNPTLKFIQGICSVPCATMITEFDEKGNSVKKVFFDQKGNLLNTKAGYAYMIMEYDDKGRNIETNCYDTNNELSNDKVVGASTVVHRYDIYGNLAEQSYYDKNGHLASTPWTWSRRLQTFNEKGEELSDTYYMPDGSVNTYQRSENGEFKLKNDLVVELPEKDRQIIILQVEGYGQMFESGFRGVYVILEFNEWNMTQDLESFTLTLMRSKGKKKHLVLLPFGNKLGEEVLEHTFSEDALGARIMDYNPLDGDEREITFKKYGEWKNNKKKKTITQ